VSLLSHRFRWTISNAHNSFVGVERLTDEEIDEIRRLLRKPSNEELAQTNASKKNGTVMMTA
jgi:low affinity Fe/Cu permease